MAAHAGKLRTIQNWIGGSAYTPKGAAFVPPPPDRVPELMKNLVTFSNQDDLPAVAQAAIAHAQFETIHPFADGNGKTGRALTHLILRRRNLTPRIMAPVHSCLPRILRIISSDSLSTVQCILRTAPQPNAASTHGSRSSQVLACGRQSM